MTTTVAGLIAPSLEDPLYSLPDTVTQLRDALATKFATWGSPSASITPAAGWGNPTSASRGTPMLRSMGPFAALTPGALELKTGTVSFPSGGDVQLGTFASSALLPQKDVELTAVAHFAEGAPTFCRFVLSATGAVLVRVPTARTMPAGAASLVLCPSAVWMAS